MSSITEAFTTSNQSEESIHNYALNIELELEKMLTDRDDLHSITDLYSDPETSLEDEEFVRKNVFNSTIYVNECKKYKLALKGLSEKIEMNIQQKQELMTKLETINKSLKNLKECSDDTYTEHLSNFDSLVANLCDDIADKATSITTMKRHIKCLFKDTHHYTSADPKRICSICLHNEVNQCVVPCGHTMCLSCASKILHSDTCFACRTPVEKIIGLYFI